VGYFQGLNLNPQDLGGALGLRENKRRRWGYLSSSIRFVVKLSTGVGRGGSGRDKLFNGPSESEHKEETQ